MIVLFYWQKDINAGDPRGPWRCERFDDVDAAENFVQLIRPDLKAYAIVPGTKSILDGGHHNVRAEPPEGSEICFVRRNHA